ncbi:MAG TPA: CPBP family intramembrane glutamic endopeptidase [bacterium]
MKVSDWRAGLASATAYGLLTVGLALAGSLVGWLLLSSWLDLSWWRIFRRCASSAAVIALWWRVKRSEGRTFSSYGVSRFRAGKGELAEGLLLGSFVLAGLLLAGLASGSVYIRITEETFRLWRTVILFIPGALLVAVIEEAVFRGYLLEHLSRVSKAFGIITTSAIFAVIHLREHTLHAAAWRELAGLFLLGSVLALAALRSRGLWLPIGLHAALAYGARVNKHLVDFQDLSWSWLTGTSRLVNGLASWTALLLLAGCLVARTGRSSSAEQPAGGQRSD